MIGRGFCGALSLSVAFAVLAGCAGQAAPGAIPQHDAVAQHPVAGSWMLPNLSGNDLLYVANTASDSGPANVYALSYPDGTLVGTLTGFVNPQGICADKSGDVFITDEDGYEIIEYAHGGTSPIQVLTDAHEPTACSVDMKSGNVAVSNRDHSASVYKHAAGVPTMYSTPFMPYFAAYDNRGDLFIDGYANPFAVAELVKRGTSFQSVALEEHTRNFRPAGLQWNAGLLAFGSANPYQYACCGRFFRYDIAGSIGVKTGSHGIRGSLSDFYIYGSNVIVTDAGNSIDIYSYPRGKTPIQTIKEPGRSAYGVTISVAPSRQAVFSSRAQIISAIDKSAWTATPGHSRIPAVPLMPITTR